MNRRTILKKMGDFVLGKGFYIILFLCVATIGISGYYLIRGGDTPQGDTEPVTGNPTLVLPDDQTDRLQPQQGSDSEKDQEEPIQSQQPDQSAADQEEQTLQNQTEPVVEAEPESSAPVVYTWPVQGEILRDFSVETLSLDPTLEDWRTHGGLDIAAQVGNQVVAMCPGTVSAVYDDDLMGTTVVIDHGEGLISTYCNLAGQPTVESGDRVETGSVIGAVGSTAIAESGLGSHLHLEVSLNGVLADPRDYLPEK